MSEKKQLNLWQKLIELRSRASITKTGTNNFGKYNYFEITKIYEFIKPILKELGLYSYTNMEYNPESQHYKLSVTIVNADNPSETVTFTKESPLSMVQGGANGQHVGSTSTYLNKYIWFDILQLDDGAVDPDKINTHEHTDIPTKKPKLTYKQKLLIQFKELGYDNEQMQEYIQTEFGKKAITETEAKKLLKKLQEQHRNA